MQVTVNYTRNLQFEATSRGHVVVSDQPHDNGGDDAGMTPLELFLASLGSCVGFYAMKYCEARKLSHEGLMVEVSAQKTKDSPIRLDDIDIHLTLPQELEARHLKGLERAADSCIIHNTLLQPPKMTTRVSTVSPAAG